MDIFEEIVRMRRAGERGALATIVHTNGSIPSYESSRMLVREDGSIAGTIGGGCVEADVWAAAKEVIEAEQPRKMTFNLNHEAEYDAGLIFGGSARRVRGRICDWNRGRPRDIRERGTFPDGTRDLHHI